MELQERENEMLGFYAFRTFYYSKPERIEAREVINEDLKKLLDENKISKESM